MAVDGRKGILEFLLINHPLDCPICDRGGECPLQDQTLKFGPGESRFYEEKRHFKKPIPLGPVLMLDRERCITCARCTRFGDVVAGDHALEFIDRGYKTEVGTIDGGPAESKFIGNTIMICPVGALTSQVYRFRARPWDNDTAASTCTLCPVGCSMTLDSRDGEIMRTRSIENRQVNDIWLCDKGWFGYEFAASSERLKTPLIRQGDALVPASWEMALTFVAEKVMAAKSFGRIAAIGGMPLTAEENYLLQKLMREVVGVNNVDYRVGMSIFSLDDEGIAPGMDMSIGECEDLEHVLLLGVDLTEEFPVMWLRLKQALNNGGKAVYLGHYAIEIAPYLENTFLHAPGKELEAMITPLAQIAIKASEGHKCAIFIGRQYLSSPHRKAILSAVLTINQHPANLKTNLLEGKENSFGARLAGMHPELAPLNERLSKPGLNVLQCLEASAKDGWDLLYVVAADPASKYPSKLWDRARQKMGLLVVQDIFLTKTAQQADVVLPSLCYIEKTGSFVNVAGYLQKLQAGKELPEGLFSDGEIFTLLAKKMDFSLQMGSDFLEALKAERLPLTKRTVPATATVAPLKASEGELRATFAPVLFDGGVRMQHNRHLTQLVKRPKVSIHPKEGEKRLLKDGSIVRLHANDNSITTKITFDVHVAEGTLLLPLGFGEIPVAELGPNLYNGMVIRVES